jgi:hypothetical protein
VLFEVLVLFEMPEVLGMVGELERVGGLVL